MDTIHDTTTRSNLSVRSINYRYRWLILVTLVLTAILEVMDTTIATVALPQMAGNLSASIEEIAWVSTGYILAAVIVLPMAAFLSARFGRKHYLLASVVLFTAASFLCGTTRSLSGVILCRILQGAGGAALTSTSQATLVQIFPPEEQAMVQPLFLLGIIAAPIFGPTLGGWITDSLSWHWCFFINVPIGIAAAAMLATYLHDDSEPDRSAPVDWLAIGLLTIGLGSMQYVLEEGQTRDWFGDSLIVRLTILSTFCLVSLLWWQLTPRNRHPVIGLRVLRNQSLAAGVLLFAVVGFGIAGVSYLYSLLAQDVQGLTPLQAGLALLPGGIATAVSILTCGVLLNQPEKAPDARWFALFGIVLTAFALWRFGQLSPQSGIADTFWPLLLRGLALGFLVVPVNQAVVSALKPDEVQQGPAMMNLADQLGSSFGIAILATTVSRHAQEHRTDLVSHLTLTNPIFTERLSGVSSALMAHGYGLPRASHGALQLMDRLVMQQAMTMSYNDAFILVLIFVVVTAPALLLLRRAARGSKPVAVTH